ncbi:hypothetical protein PHSY_007275 [Pseudozyma hubeiensis SY62]|uniref:Uncharacterized protein n=1 Tax=Pseudozyma hubeiensis (strain SY62) TaxID=1305764 RepID=R9PEI8_PSEHS|nr:hypothetical protein PHSY_007275 [Pseudozyma hubeiensis SY62]GAC99672.1 hypothetical protein PHSY_007275 [Pseudozyma hubeiensis SY62]
MYLVHESSCRVVSLSIKEDLVTVAHLGKTERCSLTTIRRGVGKEDVHGAGSGRRRPECHSGTDILTLRRLFLSHC